MKVKFNRLALQESLGLVTSIVPSRTPKPILRCLRITSGEGTVKLCATDLEVGITQNVTQVEVVSEGDIVVPADKIAAIVRESTDEVLELEAAEAMVHIRGCDSHFTIYSHEPEQYPQVPGFEGEADIVVGLGKLQEGIEHTVFAAAKESTRYALNGILWEVKGRKLTLVATDGRRLAKTSVNLDSAPSEAKQPEGRTIVPAKMMSLLGKVGGDLDARVEVRFVDNQIIMACGEVVISSNLVEGNFPKYEDIIPKDYDKKIALPADATLSAVRRAALLANEDSKGIMLSLEKGALTFSSRAPETGDAQIDMTVDYTGEPIKIGFNPQFLLEVFRVIQADEIELSLGTADRPGMIKADGNFLYILMPVNI